MSGPAVVKTLLIEDNAADARLARLALAESDGVLYEVTAVGTLAEGIATAGRQRFDVILLDLSLPDASGLTGISRLRMEHPAVPLVILTGHSDEELAIEALKEGAQDYLVKGMDSGPQMQRAIRHAIQRKKIEQMLVDSIEQAECANRAKTEFIAAMSHELRTPLNAIIGFSEIIRNESFGSLNNPIYSGYIDDIHASGVHLLQIINDILDLSKIEAGEVELSEEWFAFDDVMEAGFRIIGPRARQANVSLESASAEDPVVIYADRRRILQILTNLLSNAVKFTPAGGSVTVSSHLNREGGMEFAVTDTGIGMAPEQIPVALAPFRQVDGALSRKYEGTGLGLPLSRRLAQLHDGDLVIESALGEGTKVVVSLPKSRVRPPCNPDISVGAA